MSDLKPLPCPFCGHTGLSFEEGSTFRWGVASCDGCDATCGEIRRNYPDDGKWHAEAIEAWNRRAQPSPITSETGNQAAKGASAITSVPLLSDAAIRSAADACDDGQEDAEYTLAFGRKIESLVRSKVGAGVPMTRQQTDAMFEEVQRRANQLADEGRYTFGGWFPIAVELIEAHHGIVGKEGA